MKGTRNNKTGNFRRRKGRSMSRKIRVVMCLLVFVCGLSLASMAQMTTATLTGTVRDETGGVLPGAEVTIMNMNTGIQRTLVTDAVGRFVAAGLLPGSYEVRLMMPGFERLA